MMDLNANHEMTAESFMSTNIVVRSFLSYQRFDYTTDQ